MSSPKVQIFKGFKPYSFQKDVIDAVIDSIGKRKTITVKAIRQQGKTLLAVNLLLWFSINRKKTVSICISPTNKQAKKIWKTVHSCLEDTFLEKAANGTELTLDLINGSQIVFLSAAAGENLRGWTADFLICDEAAYWTQQSVFYTVIPFRDVKGAPMLLLSTPFVSDGYFYECYNLGKQGEDNYITIDWCDEKYREDREKILTPEVLSQYRKLLPKKVFSTEYLGEFLDGDGLVFSNIKACVKGKGKISEATDLFVGIDFGTGKGEDYTSISMIDQDGNQVYLDYFNDLGTYEQVNRLVADMKPWKDRIRVILAEQNSIGTPLTDIMTEMMRNNGMNALTSKIEDWNTTNKSKGDLVALLQVGLEQEEISILNDSVLLSQLAAYGCEYNPKTGTVSYNGVVGNDDNVISTMLSWNAYKKNNQRGHYMISGMARTMR